VNTKNNSRRRETVRKIESVLIELLRSQRLSQIKVSDVCKTAGINRSTFYANYEDIYDLANKIKERLKAEVFELFDRKVNSVDSEDHFLQLFTHIKENCDLYSFYFKLGFDDGDLDLYDIWLRGQPFGNEYMDYHIEFFKNGFNAIVKKWLNGGCAESPRQMCDILMYEYRGRSMLGSVI